MSGYSLDPISANCYPNTAVLINKFDIRDDSELLNLEFKYTQAAAADWELSPKLESFDFEHYKAIHRYLFHEFYDWAGNVRDVDISKKGTIFCPHEEIADQAGRIFTRLNKLDNLKGLKKNRFISEFVDLYMTTNYLHPFREGNGRTQRLFLAQLVRNAGFMLDFADIDIDELMIVTIQSAQGVKDGLLRVFTGAIKFPQQESLLDNLDKAKQYVERDNRLIDTQKSKSKKYER